MGNRFGHYATKAEAVAAIEARGFAKPADAFYWHKPSTDGFGFPTVAMVSIEEEYVSAEYTKSGERETYFVHEYHP